MQRNRLGELRRAAGMSQGSVGELIGVDRSVASRYESGDVKLSAESAIKLADHFGVSVRWLMGYEETPDGSDGVKVAA